MCILNRPGRANTVCATVSIGAFDVLPDVFIACFLASTLVVCVLALRQWRRVIQISDIRCNIMLWSTLCLGFFIDET